MNKSDAVNELFTALSSAQREMKGALKDSDNPFFKSNYADLESVWDACRAPLTNWGLSIIQTIGRDDNGMYLDTILAHKSGQWISSKAPVIPVKNDPQSLGSCLSYMRRYSLAALVGVYQTDDDGEAANGRGQQQGQDKKPNLKITATEMDAELGPKVAQAIKPKPAAKPVVKPLDPNAEPKVIPTRDELNKRIAGLYKPYLTKFPETKFHELLTARYQVGETRMMTTEQMLNLAEMMEANLHVAMVQQ